jgi:hypothetical protein
MIITKKTIKIVFFIIIFCGGCAISTFYADQDGQIYNDKRSRIELDFGPYPGG